MSSSKCLPPPGHTHQLRPPREECASRPVSSSIYNGTAILCIRFTLRMTYRKILCPQAWVFPSPATVLSSALGLGAHPSLCSVYAVGGDLPGLRGVKWSAPHRDLGCEHTAAVALASSGT